MQTQIQKWGNSLGIRIPKYLTGKLHLKQGTFVNLEITGNHLIISAEISELDTLLNNITDSNRHHAVLNDDDIVGNELW
ncbi:AbrB/MazE/SpoVT family DNA-binding domain-containing protein [Rickettsia endosymbiont of Polydrusus tereticollis]|uniref:AbrB/MazE/SpoVT family DNA-binding domain-containing protein n=1 Tax=Rickettsia endosymbiont of Polydrusus tereticollis TaxID=3066251 RepID=UPI003132D8BE|nr:MazF family transcriptional regulator [Rickettsia endosymbiont of Oxypoda opaca]